MTEKQILSAIEHPFLVKLKLSFQDEKKLYFLLEYCPGGELFSLMASKERLTEEQYHFTYWELSFMQPKLCSHSSNYTSIMLSIASKST